MPTKSTKEEATLNIYQKLALLRKRVEVLQKNAEGYQYTYVSEDAVLERILPMMEKYHLSLIPTIVPETAKVTEETYETTKFTKSGDMYTDRSYEHVISAEMFWTWVNNDNPEERISVPWLLVGQQKDAAQAFGAGLTYSSRYFLLKYFNIATIEDDPEAFRKRQHQVEEEERNEVLKAVKEQIDITIKESLAEHPDMKKELHALVTKHVKDGKYSTIKDMNTASKLLSELKQFVAGVAQKDKEE